jgi:ribosomal protein S18 acetylase RimI-like enzyme
MAQSLNGKVGKMSFSIRLGRREDASSIAKFQVAMALETENKQLDEQRVESAVRAVFADPAKGFYVVAESNGVVVASLLITYEWSDWRNSNMWYIQSVFVAKEERGQGIFRKLYEFVLERARSEEVMFVRLYVEVENEPAQKVYESLGMKRMPYYMYDVKI